MEIYPILTGLFLIAFATLMVFCCMRDFRKSKEINNRYLKAMLCIREKELEDLRQSHEQLKQQVIRLEQNRGSICICGDPDCYGDCLEDNDVICPRCGSYKLGNDEHETCGECGLETT